MKADGEREKIGKDAMAPPASFVAENEAIKMERNPTGKYVFIESI